MSAESNTPPRGSETVLLVEPEPEMRTLLAFMLSKQGYRILEARNAGEAMKIYEERALEVDLLFTEAHMSKINGHELAEKLLANRPGLKVLFLSDGDYERLARRIASKKGLVFLPRPFTMATMAAKVRQVLDGPGGNYVGQASASSGA